ncbi:MAG: hypothetical protein CL581_12125 [Alteromonadaceae bacterium]|uniref:DUF2835 domain-containing protein n=1 Tax=Marinobacter sp. V034 TaxID=3459610 RepID=UPI000C3CDC8D|nr:hypothetical protein [Alteromonadaceae bacterium]MBH86095.1 hypothetical protein [Alteromonadaceae bacterium]|tara:strand:- start:1944 stop:2171 length:228 start_codon:yes stop_codon:yes gene_type:complete
MKSIIVDIAIGPQEWLKLYEGVARDVSTVSRDGRTVRFPARILSRFALRDGVNGSFQINFDDTGKFHSVERLGTG